MPLYEYRCQACRAIHEHYVHARHLALEVCVCEVCGDHAPRLMGKPNMLQYFSERNGRVIDNLDQGRVLHSHKAHQDLMRAKKVEPATDWHVSVKPSKM